MVSTNLPTGPFFTLLVKSPELGAQPSVYLAVSEEMEGVTGRYYDVMTEKEPAPQSLDEEAARRLWEVSSRLVGLEEEGQSVKSNPPAEGQNKAAQTRDRAQDQPSVLLGYRSVWLQGQQMRMTFIAACLRNDSLLYMPLCSCIRTFF